jgi:hypothetical protein
LERLKTADASIPKVRGADDFSATTEFIRNVRTAQIDLSCSVEELTPYLRSSNAFIATGAKASKVAYQLISRNYDQMVAIFKRTVDKSQNDGDIADSFASTLSDLEDTESLLAEATASAAPALMTHKAKPASGFAVTESQRVDLLRRLERGFGPSVKRDSVATQVIAAAASLYHALSVAR